MQRSFRQLVFTAQEFMLNYDTTLQDSCAEAPDHGDKR
jgi:hypothetical protein